MRNKIRQQPVQHCLENYRLAEFRKMTVSYITCFPFSICRIYLKSVPDFRIKHSYVIVQKKIVVLFFIFGLGGYREFCV